jgi:sulfur carrier protein ThiS adenylyltransferase
MRGGILTFLASMPLKKARLSQIASIYIGSSILILYYVTKISDFIESTLIITAKLINLLNIMNPETVKILSSKSVGIAGAGGLGSNCAVALARVGIGRIIIADFDIVDVSNLNRQYYFLHQLGQKKVVALRNNINLINIDVDVHAHDVKLGPDEIVEIYSESDIIVEAFDLAEMKQMIIETVLERMPGKTIVSGVGLAGWGDNNSITTKYSGKLIVCGDGTTEVSEEMPPLAPRVGIVANMQANVVLEILLGKSIG